MTSAGRALLFLLVILSVRTYGQGATQAPAPVFDAVRVVDGGRYDLARLTAALAENLC